MNVTIPAPDNIFDDAVMRELYKDLTDNIAPTPGMRPFGIPSGVIPEVVTWFEDQGIAFNLDDNDQLTFERSSDAILFKLTWGGA